MAVTKTKKAQVVDDIEEVHNDEVDNDEVDNNEDEDEDTEDDDFVIGDDEEISLTDLMQNFFASEEGENIVDTLTGIKKAIETQNKILMKMGAVFEKYANR